MRKIGIGKNIARQLAALLVVSAIMPSVARAGDDPIRITLYGEEANVPYAYLENQRAAGIYPRILRAALDRLPQYDVQFAAVPFKRGMDMLKSGRIMGFFPPYYRKNRDWITRYSIPILKEVGIVLCSDDFMRRRAPKDFPQDFRGARFANNDGYRMAGAEFFKMVERGEIMLEQGNTTISNLRFLMAGRVDCYINERMAILAAKRKLGVKPGRFRSFQEAAVTGHETGYVAYGPDPENRWPYRDRFADDLDHVLSDMRDRGEIDQLIDDYFAY